MIVGLLLKRSSPRCSRKPDVPDLHWMLAVHRLRGHRYFRQHLLVDKKQKGQRRCPAMPAPACTQLQRQRILMHKDLRALAMLWGKPSQSCRH